jgi:hypothetical protein
MRRRGGEFLSVAAEGTKPSPGGFATQKPIQPEAWRKRMATSPGSRQRDTRTGTARDDRDLIDPMVDPMQEPLGSMDRPVPRGRDLDDLNLTPGDPGYTGTPRPIADRRGGSATTSFAVVAVLLLAAFLVALYLGNNRSQVATGGGSQAPIADSNGATGIDTTGSTTTPPPPQTAPGTGTTGTAPATP